MDWVKVHVLSWLLGAIPVGAISFALFQWVKKLSGGVDRLPAAVKRYVALPIVAALVTAGGAAVGVNVICDTATNCLSQITQPTLDNLVKGALAVIVAWIAHAGKSGNTSG